MNLRSSSRQLRIINNETVANDVGRDGRKWSTADVDSSRRRQIIGATAIEVAAQTGDLADKTVGYGDADHPHVECNDQSDRWRCEAYCRAVVGDDVARAGVRVGYRYGEAVQLQRI